MSEPKITTNTAGNPILARVYGVQTVEDCRALYDEWAKNFDKDLTDPSQDYVAPTLVAQTLLANNVNITSTTTIFDAGCGTGLSGIPLAQAGAKTIDGVDLSPEMLKVAEKTGVYRSLTTADLSKPINRQDGEMGTLTHGHVGPIPALQEFVRITKSGGVVAATILDDIWESGGYKVEAERLRDQGFADIVSADSKDYRRGANVKARILVLRKK